MPDSLREAATLILIRDSEQGLQVYMTKRPETMLFLPGYYVFPGGGMQPEDRDPRLHSYCMKQSLEVELSYAITAIRECFEEVGYLLADFPVASDSSVNLQAVRHLFESGELLFQDWVLTNQIRLRTDKLRYYGHRITPRSLSSRRFDTRYFLTVVPPETNLQPSRKEVAEADWISPRVALEYAKRGAAKMVPPTMDALSDLARFHTAEEAFWQGAGVGTPRPHELA